MKEKNILKSSYLDSKRSCNEQNGEASAITMFCFQQCCNSSILSQGTLASYLKDRKRVENGSGLYIE